MIEVMIQDERSYCPEITTLDFNLYFWFGLVVIFVFIIYKVFGF